MSPCPLQPLAAPTLLSICLNWVTLDFCLLELESCSVCPCAWLISLSITSLWLICVAACDRILFLIKAEQQSLVCPHCKVFISLSVGGHLDYFHPLTIRSNVRIHVFVGWGLCTAETLRKEGMVLSDELLQYISVGKKSIFETACTAVCKYYLILPFPECIMVL